LIKNSQPFGKKFQKTVGGGVDSHCRLSFAASVICRVDYCVRYSTEALWANRPLVG